jgi:cysteine-rich repeat protein
MCGDGVTEPPETCDDGNTTDNDACPADCIVDPCTPVTGVNVAAVVSFAAGNPVGGMTLLVDYPEGQVHIPVTGPIPPSNFVPLIPPSEVLVRGFDFDHMLRVAVADGDPTEPIPVGALAQVTFQQCQGQPAPVTGDVGCLVIEASDPFQNPTTGVTCAVSIP